MNPAPQNIAAANLRIDFTRSDKYIYPEPPKLSFWQKLGRGVAQGMSFLGPIGAAVSAVALPGIGLPIAAGLFGLTKLSQDSLYRSNVKDQIAMQSQQQPGAIALPGLFDTTPQAAGESATEFMAPQSMAPNITDVIINRDAARFEAGHL